jgi:hypothetical protein
MNGIKAFLSFSLSNFDNLFKSKYLPLELLAKPSSVLNFAKQRMRQNKLYKLLHFEALELLIFQILKGVIYPIIF